MTTLTKLTAGALSWSAVTLLLAITGCGTAVQDDPTMYLVGSEEAALTGTDAASNALFGSQQVITANKLSLSPTLMAAANSSGGVMGKMIDAQSIVVASVATNYIGKEGVILRYVFWHSLALAALVGLFVMLQAYVFPAMIPG